MRRNFLVYIVWIGICASSSVSLYAREHPVALDDSTDRVTYTYDVEPVFFGPSSATAEIDVPDFFDIYDVDVTVDINHTWDADIELTLISPDDEQVFLCGSVGGAGHDMHETEFNDSAEVPISQGTAPFTGSFIPMESLSGFNGGTGTGTWTLLLEDNFPSLDNGTLNWWSLTLGGRRVGTLHGNVTELSDGDAISGVQVATAGGLFSTTSDAQGEYWLMVQEGTYFIEFTKNGWCGFTSEEYTFEFEDTFALDVQLQQPLLRSFVSSVNVLVPQNLNVEYSYRFVNDGNCDLDWNAEASDEWFQVMNESGSIAPGDTGVITLSFDAQGQALGDINGELTIQHNGPSSPDVVPVLMLVSQAVSSPEQNGDLPTVFALQGNYPNPFNAETTIQYALPVPSQVRLTIFDVSGREIATLVNGEQDAGEHGVSFDGSHFASGVYFARLKAGEFTASHKLVLLK